MGVQVGAPPSTPCPHAVPWGGINARGAHATGWDTLWHRDDDDRVTPQGTAPGLGGTRGLWLGGTRQWGVGDLGVVPTGVEGVTGGECHGDSRKTEDGGPLARGGGSMPVGTQLPLESLWVSPWVAVSYLRWLRRWQHPPVPSAWRARPMSLHPEGHGDTPGAAMGTHRHWPPCPRLVPVLVE